MKTEENRGWYKFIKTKLTGTRFCQHLATGPIQRIVVDVNDVKGVTFISHVYNGPFESILAALGEVHCHTNFPILYHAFLPLLSLLCCCCCELEELKPNNKGFMKKNMNGDDGVSMAWLL